MREMILNNVKLKKQIIIRYTDSKDLREKTAKEVDRLGWEYADVWAVVPEVESWNES